MTNIFTLKGLNFLGGETLEILLMVKKSGKLTSWYGQYPIIYKVLYIPAGAGSYSVEDKVVEIPLFMTGLMAPSQVVFLPQFWTINSTGEDPADLGESGGDFEGKNTRHFSNFPATVLGCPWNLVNRL